MREPISANMLTSNESTSSLSKVIPSWTSSISDSESRLRGKRFTCLNPRSPTVHSEQPITGWSRNSPARRAACCERSSRHPQRTPTRLTPPLPSWIYASCLAAGWRGRSVISPSIARQEIHARREKPEGPFNPPQVLWSSGSVRLARECQRGLARIPVRSPLWNGETDISNCS